MSHTTKIEIQFKDMDCLKESAKALNLETVEGKIRLFSSTHHGLGIKLPGWKYPVVFTEQGEMFYDNYNGSWGNKRVLDEYLDKLKTEYAKAVTKKVITQKMEGTITAIKQTGDKIVIEAEIPEKLLNYLT